MKAFMQQHTSGFLQNAFCHPQKLKIEKDVRTWEVA
jgi:hypothetical protein